jgi:hypothetical protein
VARVPADATAFVHRAAPFDLIVIAGGFRPEETEKNFAWARGVSSAMRPFNVFRLNQNIRPATPARTPPR